VRPSEGLTFARSRAWPKALAWAFRTGGLFRGNKFAEMINRARADGRRSIRLDTFAANPGAMALYQKLGYRPVGWAMMRKGVFIGFEKLL
jgi:ribosomal protein S18 acetylase RimI-like enzyme